MPPHGSPTTQAGATREVAPRKEEETTWDTVTSHRQTGAPSDKKDYRVPVDLHCKYITDHEMFNIQMLLPVENEAVPQEYEQMNP
jgi:hypothetical protein